MGRQQEKTLQELEELKFVFNNKGLMPSIDEMDEFDLDDDVNDTVNDVVNDAVNEPLKPEPVEESLRRNTRVRVDDADLHGPAGQPRNL